MMDAVVDTFREGAGFSENVTDAVVTSLALNEWGADFELHECYVLAFFRASWSSPSPIVFSWLSLACVITKMMRSPSSVIQAEASVPRINRS